MPDSEHAHNITPTITPAQESPGSPEVATQDHYLGSAFGLLVAGLATMGLQWFYRRKNRQSVLKNG